MAFNYLSLSVLSSQHYGPFAKVPLLCSLHYGPSTVVLDYVS